jgi:hypothetical protein
VHARCHLPSGRGAGQLEPRVASNQLAFFLRTLGVEYTYTTPAAGPLLVKALENI